jgi:putative transferase (TIGR04331 family)
LGELFLEYKFRKATHQNSADSHLTLVTTALEETWNPQEQILFLGRWCLKPTRRHVWQEFDASVLDYHWDDRSLLKMDLIYLTEVYENLLPDISSVLNEIHGTTHSVRYWRIVTGHWLFFFIQVFFDRWSSVSKACSLYPHMRMKSIVDSKFNLPAQDSRSFDSLTSTDDWNERLYSEIVRDQNFLQSSNISMAERLSPEAARNYTKALVRGNFNQYFKKALRASSFASPNRSSRFYLHEEYLSISNHMRLAMRLGDLPYLSLRQSTRLTEFAEGFRDWEIGQDASEDQFVKVFCRFLPRYMPRVFLEGYDENSKYALRRIKARNPKVIFTCNAFNTDDVWKLYSADKVEAGAKLVIGQHGGNYGIGLMSAMQNEEIAIADSYLTWGWNDESKPRVIAAPATKLIAKLSEESSRTKCVHVLASMPRYSGWLYSAPMGPQYSSYLNDQLSFVRKLKGTPKDHLVARSTADDFGWDLEQTWKSQFPDVQFDKGSRSFRKAIQEAKLVVATYNATTFLETFSANIPTVIFWNPELWELNNEAEDYFQRLKSCNIYFDDPTNCASFINRHWDEIDSWWDSQEVRKAVVSFCDRYAYTGSNPISALSLTLKRLSNS